MTATTDLNIPALQERVKKILTDPKNEWNVIEPEATTLEKLYKSYIIPLAAIPVVATLIGSVIVGVNFGLGTYRTPLVRGLVTACVSYVLALAMVYVSALVISKLASNFASKSDDLQALKLVAYAYTPAWVAGVLQVIPALGVLAILGGLYSIYLLYLGLPVMMKTPQDKVIPYMVVAALVLIVLTVVVGLITVALVGTAALATI